MSLYSLLGEDATRPAGTFVTEIGLPEVDELLHASIFTKPTATKHTVAVHPRRFQKDVFQLPHLKKCSSLGGASEDDINRLPDDILPFIVSRLQLNECAATSVLSRRWRHVWSSSVSVLDLDLVNKAGHDHLAGDDAQTRLVMDRSFLHQERRKFTRWLYQVLQRHRAPKVDALRISFPLGRESEFVVDLWMEHVADKGLAELELDLNLVFVGYSEDVAYEFPFRLFTSSSLNYMRLKCVCFNFPPVFKGFGSLKSLTLADCFLYEDTVQNILANCSSLECLSLMYCRTSGSLSKLEFSGPSLRLKHLRIFRFVTTLDYITKIELHDVGIMSFEYKDQWSTKLSIRNTPRLSRLVLCTEKPVEILGYVPSVETLFMPTWSSVNESILPNLHAFNNLKRLVFIVNDDTANLLQVMCILETCPSLQMLELDMGISSTEGIENLTEIATRPGRPYKNLKEIEVYGFQDHRGKLELVKYLLRNGIVLKMIKISRTSRMYLGNGKWSLYKETAKQTRSLWEIWNRLKEEVSSSGLSLNLSVKLEE